MAPERWPWHRWSGSELHCPQPCHAGAEKSDILSQCHDYVSLASPCRTLHPPLFLQMNVP